MKGAVSRLTQRVSLIANGMPHGIQSRDMSVYESIHVHHPIDVEKYVTVLKTEFGARENPSQPGSFVLGDPPQPFYEPKLTENEDDVYMVILGFNYIPLHPHLLVALINHPELVPEHTTVVWTIEQDLIAHGTLFELKHALLPEEK
jgi:hypothetical protein